MRTPNVTQPLPKLEKMAARYAESARASFKVIAGAGAASSAALPSPLSMVRTTRAATNNAPA
ncbi:hypothetical protein D3C73_1651440 [compost metagenome]